MVFENVKSVSPKSFGGFAVTCEILDFFYCAVYNDPKHWTVAENTAKLRIGGLILNVSTDMSFPALFFIKNYKKRRKFVLVLSNATLSKTKKESGGLKGEWWYYSVRGKITKKFRDGVYGMDCGDLRLILETEQRGFSVGDFVEARGRLVLDSWVQIHLNSVKESEIELHDGDKKEELKFNKWFVFKRHLLDKNKSSIELYQTK